MEDNVFNLILGDMNGLPSLPMFIGNYLLDLLTTFFPLFILLSSFVMVYVGLTRGSGDWKNTAQQIAPTAIALGVILAILSMKTPYKDKGANGAFWEDANSYVIVEMMNTFLSFGNIFADALTHKIIYGSISVTPGNASYEGYFPAVLQGLIDKQENQSKFAVFLKENNREDIIKSIDSNNRTIAANLNNYVEKLHNLGIVDDYRKVTNQDLDKYKSDRKRMITSDGKENLVLNYTIKPQQINVKTNNSEINTIDSNNTILNKPTSDSVNFTTNDFITMANGGDSSKDNFTIYPEKGYQGYYVRESSNGSNVVPLNNANMKKTLSYMFINNFDNEKDMINISESMLSNYMSVYDEYSNVINKIQSQKDKEKDKELNLAMEKELKIYESQQGLIKGQIAEIAKFYSSINNTINKIGELNDVEINTISSGTISKFDSIFGSGYFDGLNISEVISKNELLSLKDKAATMNPNDEMFWGMTYREYNNRTINTAKLAEILNQRMLTKSYITNVIYDKFQELLKDDALFQELMNFNSTAPFNLVFLPSNQYNALLYLENKKNELINTKEGNKSIADSLKEDIEKQYATSGINFMHWTDLGKHYGTFKNLFSPMISNMVYLNQVDEVSNQKAASLIQFMEQMEPGAKTSRLLTTSSYVAAGTLAAGAAKIATTKIKGSSTLSKIDNSKPLSFGFLWDTIKVIGGVYFAIMFVNVILPSFIWMFVIVSYYIEMALYVAVFPIGFMFMIFQSYRQSLHQYINMILGFILMPIILVSMYFVVLYMDMLLPLLFKQFMPFFGSYSELHNTFSTSFAGGDGLVHNALSDMFPNPVDVDVNSTTNSIFASLGNIIYTILSMIMSSLLLMTFFRANEYMSKILNVSTVGMDSFQSRETLSRFSGLDKSGITKSMS